MVQLPQGLLDLLTESGRMEDDVARQEAGGLDGLDAILPEAVKRSIRRVGPRGHRVHDVERSPSSTLEELQGLGPFRLHVQGDREVSKCLEEPPEAVSDPSRDLTHSPRPADRA